MKKFGTPMRAAPGVESEKVGLAGLGVPSGRTLRSTASPGVFRTLSAARPAPLRRLPAARLTGLSSP
jgi:hypothetical protein